MSATAKRHARIDRRRRTCPNGAHAFPKPLHGKRPLVVFCTLCQTGKDIPA